MSIAIIHRRGSKTGKALAQALGAARNPQYGEFDLVIRWGSIKNVAIEANFLNQMEGIAKAADKVAARQVLRDNGIPVPAGSETEFPVVGRPARHQGGDGFFYCENEYEVEQAKAHGAVYFSRFYPKTREIRVHVAGGKSILMSEKEGDKSQKIWNHQKSGFNLRHLHRNVWLNDPVLRKAQRYAKRAVEALGLDFGAVDIMAFPTDGQPSFVITEVNTAPSLSPLALSKYVAYFMEQ